MWLVPGPAAARWHRCALPTPCLRALCDPGQDFALHAIEAELSDVDNSIGNRSEKHKALIAHFVEVATLVQDDISAPVSNTTPLDVEQVKRSRLLDVVSVLRAIQPVREQTQ